MHRPLGEEGDVAWASVADDGGCAAFGDDTGHERGPGDVDEDLCGAWVDMGSDHAARAKEAHEHGGASADDAREESIVSEDDAAIFSAARKGLGVEEGEGEAVLAEDGVAVICGVGLLERSDFSSKWVGRSAFGWGGGIGGSRGDGERTAEERGNDEGEGDMEHYGRL